jgi:hypothetical protein
MNNVFDRLNDNSEKKTTDNLNLNRCIKNRISNFVQAIINSNSSLTRTNLLVISLYEH